MSRQLDEALKLAARLVAAMETIAKTLEQGVIYVKDEGRNTPGPEYLS